MNEANEDTFFFLQYDWEEGTFLSMLVVYLFFVVPFLGKLL